MREETYSILQNMEQNPPLVMPKRTTDKDNLAFHLELLKQIPYQRKITARELHQQMLALGYTKSLRAVQRALVRLTQEYEIDCDDRSPPYGYYRLGRQPITQSLTGTQAAFIQIATEKLAKSVPANFISAMKPLVEQAEHILKYGNQQAPERAWLRNVRLKEKHPDVSESILLQLSDLIYQRKQALLFSTILGSQHTVSPLGLLETAFSVYLIAHLQGEIKAFDLRYISKIQPLTLTSEQPAGFNLAHYDTAATQFDTPVITLSSHQQPTEEKTMFTQNQLTHYLATEEDESSARVHIIARGSFGKNVLKDLALPKAGGLSVEFLESQQVSQYENEKLDFLFVITDEFDWLQLQNYQDVEAQFIIGSRPYRGLIKPHSCFVYGQSEAHYRTMIQDILNNLLGERLIQIDYTDLKNLLEKGSTGIVATSFRSGDATSRRAEEAATAILTQLRAASTNLSQIHGCFISVMGNENLELGEMQTIMETLMAEINPDATILLGADFDNSVNGLQVNVLMMM